MTNKALIRKYNVPGPRYTSYPPVASWDKVPPTQEDWKKHVKNTFKVSNKREGISLYIHLPFCESLCTYCGCNTRITINHAVEKPYINTIIKEWQLYLDLFGEKPKIAEIHLGGGTPTFFTPENLKFLIESIQDSSIMLAGAELGFEAHPKNTSKEHLKTLYNLGFRRLSLGIQDFDFNVQKIVNRIQPFEMVEAVVTQAREIGYSSINFDLIYGLPLQSEATIQDTIDKVSRLKPERIAFYSYAHVPWLKPGQRMFTERDLPNGDGKRNLYEKGKQLLEKAGYLEIGMDHFALPTDGLYQAMKHGKLHRNFMGYTSRQTQLMIGLGASSIGDTGTAYGQNIKSVEKYQEVVSDGNLPIFKGHTLSKLDLILRDHISNLMCRFQTSWNRDNDGTNHIPEAIASKLKPLVNDGLVWHNESKINVLLKGRAFVRNICMAIDSQNWPKESERNVYSKVI